MPRHADEGRSILASIKRSIDYGKNPDKTRDGLLVSSYECDPRTAALEFTLAKKQYLSITGREQSPEHDILLYQIRQSFRPGEISAEDANRIAYELAMRFTKGRHAFVVTTHEDKKHIHSHIYYNSTRLDCAGKFENFLWSSLAVRRVSDRLCLENGLSIVEHPGRKGKHYGDWLGENRPPSYQARLRAAIDAALEQKPASFDAFLLLMKEAGYQIGGGKHVTFLAPDQKRPTRCDTLRGDYTEAAIRERIAGKRIPVPRQETPDAGESPEAANLRLLIDIQNSIKAKDSPGYARWAKLFNIKQLSQTINFVTENGLSLESLDEKAREAAARFNTLSGKIRAADTRMGEIAHLQKHIGAYGKTRDVYAAYRQSGYSKKFLAEHGRDISLHKEAKQAFDALGLKKIPSIRALQQEYAALLSEKKTLYAEYHAARQAMKDTLTAKANLDRLLNRAGAERENEKGGPQV
jgi:hypothetical protein